MVKVNLFGYNGRKKEIITWGLIDMSNIHENCENYNSKRDMCLKWFETDVSERYTVCKEKTVFSDRELSRKWSN